MLSGKSVGVGECLTSAAFIAATSRRKRAIETANGFLSTPCRPTRTLRIRTQGSVSLVLFFPGFASRRAKRAEQEVAGAAGRVDHPERRGRSGRARGGSGSRPNSSIAGVERQVEDELLDELRGLQQREGLLGVLGQVLVEVAEEAGVPAGSLKSWTTGASRWPGCARTRADPWPHDETA